MLSNSGRSPKSFKETGPKDGTRTLEGVSWHDTLIVSIAAWSSQVNGVVCGKNQYMKKNLTIRMKLQDSDQSNDKLKLQDSDQSLTT
jgi:hypothetical protein